MESMVTEIQNNTHKPIEINIDRELTHQENDVINELENTFPKSDFYFIKNENKLVFNLREIDLSFFQNKLNKLINKHQINDSDNIFTQLLDNIKNIKSYGLKGNKRLYVDYNKERKVKNRKAKEAERGVYYYAQDHNFNKKNNELPDEFTNQIICGDSSEVLKKLPDNCVDLVFTSPPYNFGLDYENHKDGTDWNDYFDKLFAVFKECIRVVKYGGRIIVNVQPLFSDYIPIHHTISDFFMKNKLIWRGEILWEKNNYNCKYTAWGSWKSPSNPYLKNSWEYLEIFCKGDLKKQGSVKDIDINGEEFKKWVFSRWSIAPERKMKEFGHPAMFPEELVVRVLKLFSFRSDVILDPFNGVGTTTVVTKKLERKYFGIDISEEYCKTAKKRISSLLF